MPTLPQRIASTFAVLCGQYGDVTKLAKDREQSRQSLYRQADQVANAVEGAAAQARIDRLKGQVVGGVLRVLKRSRIDDIPALN